jgi:hypothetical protein
MRSRPPKRHRAPTRTPPECRPARSYVIFHISAADRADQITLALRRREVGLDRLQTIEGADRGSPVLLLLCDELLAENGDPLDELAHWQGQIIPVVLSRLDLDAPQAIEEIARLDVQGMSAEDAAELISLSLRVSPDWMLAWRELESNAERYLTTAGGSSAAVLLNASELERANQTVLERPRREIPGLPPNVKRLLDASEHAVRRRRRLRFTFAACIVAALAGTALIATIQRHAALQAAAGARSASRRSEADRLDRLATADLSSDPDLPVLLARRAYVLAPGPQSREVLRRTLDSGPWHRSYPLAGSPTSLASSAGSPVVVVSFADGSVTLIDARDGHMIATAARPRGYDGSAVASLSSDGRLIAVAYNGGLVQVRSADATFRLLFSWRMSRLARAESLSIAWRPGDRDLLTAWSGQPATVIDTQRRSARPVGSARIASAAAVAVFGDGTLAAIAGANRVVIMKTASLRACAVVPEPAGTDDASLVPDGARDTLILVDVRSAPVQIPIPPRCHSPAGTSPDELDWPAASGAAAATVIGGGTVAVATLSGNVVLQVPPATYSVDSFLAGTGALTGIANTSSGLVTVGEDRWLRVWDVGDPAPIYPVGPAQQIAQNETPGAPAATWRAMIAINEAGTKVSVGGLSSGFLWVGDARHLSRPGLRAFVALDASIRPALSGECTGLTITSGGDMRELKCAKGHLISVWRRDPKGDSDLPTLSNSAISADGRLVALAGNTQLEVTNTTTHSTSRERAPHLVSVAFDRADEMIGANADGALLLVDRSGSARDVPVDLGDEVQAAGIEPSGDRVLLISPDGRVALVSTANGAVLKRLTLPSSASSVIDARASDDGRLAVILARDGYWVIDLARWRVIASGEGYDESDLGTQPRDAAFLGSNTLLLLRADEGIQRIALAHWRFLDGQALLNATAEALPRDLAPGEADAPTAISSDEQ